MKQIIFVFALVIVVTGAWFSIAQASKTITFVSTINPGILTTDIRDSQGKPVQHPQVKLGPVANSDECRSSDTALTGVFGEDDKRIYIDNPKATKGGWTLAIAPAQGDQAKWQGVKGHIIDFDDPGSNYQGCNDTDRDGAAGYLSIDPSEARLIADCLYCSVDNLVLGSGQSATFASSKSLTLVRANQLAEDIGSWYITDIDVKQTIPPSQKGDVYSIDLVLTATAS